MPKETIVDNEFATLWYYPESGIVHHQFKKFVPVAPFKEILDKGTELIKARKATKWLSDDRKNTAIPKDASDWAVSDWFPRTAKAGWKHWAILIPEAVVGQLSLKRQAAEFAKGGVNAQFFTDTAAAQKWLENQA